MLWRITAHLIVIGEVRGSPREEMDSKTSGGNLKSCKT